MASSSSRSLKSSSSSSWSRLGNDEREAELDTVLEDGESDAPGEDGSRLDKVAMVLLSFEVVVVVVVVDVDDVTVDAMVDAAAVPLLDLLRR